MAPEITLNVPVPGHPYDVFIGNDLDSFLREWLIRIYPGKKLFVVVDDYFYSLYEHDVEKLFEGFEKELFRLKASEEAKNHETLFSIYDFLMEKECDRDSLIVTFGGGITGDVGGFAAATFMRGIEYVQIPTTLLAQVDSSVGGKTGVNYRDGKNYIGAFHQPSAVFVDVRYLKTLDERNFKSGFAEIIKSGVIGDREIVDLIRGKNMSDVRSDDALLVELIRRSISFKIGVVSEDEKERGMRKLLNFGHTIGHALEEATGYRKLLHGEAVAVGMGMETQISLIAGYCTEETRNVVMGIIEDMGFDFLPEFVDYSLTLTLVEKDKKREGEKLVIPVVREIGRGELKVLEASEFCRLAAESLEFLRGFKQATIGTRLKSEVLDDVSSLEKSGRFQEAEDLLRRYLQADPGNEKMLIALANLLKCQGRMSEAVNALDELLQVNPGNQDAVRLRKELEEELSAVEEIPEAKEGVPSERVVQLDDEVFIIEGVEEEGEEVVEEEEESVSEEEGEVPVHTTAMAEVLMKRGELEKARELLERILRDNPEDVRANDLMSRVAESLDVRKRGEKLIAALEKFRRKIVEVFE